SDDAQGALLRAVAFVQGEIRYVGLDMGENSHAPHTPEVTLRNRYGDCKDKATLLIALLQLAGIRAEPVLVSSDKGHGLDLRLPSPYAFDHVVVRAHLPQGEVWVDATR
ncbi:MAG: transglutaminase domain-containing protein, partial [Xanthomonas perforans]|nr:transglutaminase domain-containing protein [Xanthomonas perforans]